MRILTSRYKFVGSAVMMGTRWFWIALAASTAIIGGTIVGYAHFAANRPLVIALGAAALFLLILEALYREYGATSEAEQRNRLLQVLAEVMNEGNAIPDEYGPAIGDWRIKTANQLDEFDPGYAAEFRLADDFRKDSLRVLQDIMRAVRTQGSHLARKPK